MKKIIRIVAGEHYLAHTDPLFCQLEILKVEDIYKFFILQYEYRHFDCFATRVDRYPIRGSHEIVPRFQRLSMMWRLHRYYILFIVTGTPMHGYRKKFFWHTYINNKE